MKKGKDIAVIGGGPSGLMAAETALAHGARVTLYDSMPSVGRKFLVAGKSGLNLTFDEPLELFLKRYSGPKFPTEHWRKIITAFDNNALREWSKSLGIETFTASSGKVFPLPVNGNIRAAPLLRRWIERLRKQNLIFKTRHRWQGFKADGSAIFEYEHKHHTVKHDATILALGGGSWPHTGSDSNWIQYLEQCGVCVEPLSPANCGWETHWPEPIIREAEGMPVKNITLSANTDNCNGELVITRYGLEGGPIYRLGPSLRAMESPEVMIDFKPNVSHAELLKRMGKVHRNFIREARRRWKLDPATCSLLKHMPDRGPWKSVEQLAHEVKNCRIPLTQPRPIAEAISSAGGICWNEIDNTLMLKNLPGIYATGEMLNWEAPTGGYLMQGCFATGHWAGTTATNC